MQVHNLFSKRNLVLKFTVEKSFPLFLRADNFFVTLRAPPSFNRKLTPGAQRQFSPPPEHRDSLAHSLHSRARKKKSLKVRLLACELLFCNSVRGLCPSSLSNRSTIGTLALFNVDLVHMDFRESELQRDCLWQFFNAGDKSMSWLWLYRNKVHRENLCSAERSLVFST